MRNPSRGNIFIAALILITLPTTPPTDSSAAAQPTDISPTAAATTHWKTYTNQQLGFSVKLPGEISEGQRATYGLELSNLVKEFSTVTGAIGTDHEMVDTFWITVQVADKGSSQIDSFDWLLGVSGYVQDPTNIPQGDIYLAYERAKTDKTGLPAAINFKSSILSQKKGSDRYELGLDNGAKFIYSNIFSKSSSPYAYVVSLYIYSPSLFPPSGKWLTDWVNEEKAAMGTYRRVVDSFKPL